MSYKRFFLLLGTLCVLLACAPLGLSQETQVSGQVLAPDGMAYQAGTGTFSISCPGNEQPYVNGSVIPRTIPLVRLDGTGSFSQQLYDTSFMTDINSQPLSCSWKASFVDNCGVATFGVTFTGITGSAVTVTSQISAVSVPLSAACTTPGTLNSVTLGNLPPLFTVTEGGAAINPVFNFVPDQVGANLVLAGPTTGNVDTSANANGSSTSPSATATPSNASEGVIFIGTYDFLAGTGAFPVPTTPASGWSAIDQNAPYGVFANATSSVSPYTATSTLGFTSNWTATLLLLGTSGAITRAQATLALCSGSVGNNVCPGTFASPITAGHTILVLVDSGEASGLTACSARDTLANQFSMVATNSSATTRQIIFLTGASPGGSDTVTVTCVTSGGGLFAGAIAAYDLTNITSVNGAYSFRHLVGGDLPLPTLSSLGGVDAYTSPTHQFVTAINADGSVSSAQPTTADISGSFVTAVNGTANQITSSGGNTPTLSLPSTLIAPGTFTATTSITDSGLTANRCVQTTTGGLLTVATGACSTTTGFTQVETGVISSPCTPPSTNSFDSCSSTVTWPTSFANTSYVTTCTAVDPAANGGSSSSNDAGLLYVQSQAVGSALIILQNGRGSQAFTPSSVSCIAIHP